MKKENHLITQKTDMYRLQPGLIIKPKLHHNCPSCNTIMTLTKNTKIKSDDLKKIIRAAHRYNCPGCNIEWLYDSYFRLIND